MKNINTHFPLLFLWLPFFTISQNLPSLLTDRNINATFSILAYDEKAQEWGIAVATNNIYVGNSTIYISPGVGAFSVIAETEPKYGIEGLEKLSAGKSIKQALLEVKQEDGMAHLRQVSNRCPRKCFCVYGQRLELLERKRLPNFGQELCGNGQSVGSKRPFRHV